MDEICTNGELHAYRRELEIAIQLAWNHGFTVTTRYDCRKTTRIGISKDCVQLPLDGKILFHAPGTGLLHKHLVLDQRGVGV